MKSSQDRACGVKKQHDSVRAAFRAADVLAWKERCEVGVYRCPYCGFYHIGKKRTRGKLRRHNMSADNAIRGGFDRSKAELLTKYLEERRKASADPFMDFVAFYWRAEFGLATVCVQGANRETVSRARKWAQREIRIWEDPLCD